MEPLKVRGVRKKVDELFRRINEYRDPDLPLSAHLQELRTRLFYSIISLVVFAIGGFVYARELMAILIKPLSSAIKGLPLPPQLHFTSLTEPLFQSFKVALFAGILFSVPVWLWHLWKFAAPGLYPEERKVIRPFIYSSLGLFVLGVLFAYYLAVPFAYRFLILYANPQLEEKTQKIERPIEVTLQNLKEKNKKNSNLSRDGQKANHLDKWEFYPPAQLIKALRLNASNLLESLPGEIELELKKKGKTEATHKLKIVIPSEYRNSSTPLGALKPILTLREYLSVSMWFLIGFGFVFQTPIVIFFLTGIGLFSVETLRKYRRHAFVVILVIAAVLTPTGDPVNLMIMALPMYILYEIGLLASKLYQNSDGSGKDKGAEGVEQKTAEREAEGEQGK